MNKSLKEMEDSRDLDKSSHVIWVLNNKTTERKSSIREPIKSSLKSSIREYILFEENMCDMNEDTFQEENLHPMMMRQNNTDEPGK